MRVGERFLGARVHCRDTATYVRSLARSISNAGSITSLSDETDSASGSADETVVLTNVVTTTKVAGLQVQILVAGNAASHRIYLVEYQVDFPAP
jgi:hypothetical protein